MWLYSKITLKHRKSGSASMRFVYAATRERKQIVRRRDVLLRTFFFFVLCAPLWYTIIMLLMISYYYNRYLIIVYHSSPPRRSHGEKWKRTLATQDCKFDILCLLYFIKCVYNYSACCIILFMYACFENRSVEHAL